MTSCSPTHDIPDDPIIDDNHNLVIQDEEHLITLTQDQNGSYLKFDQDAWKDLYQSENPISFDDLYLLETQAHKYQDAIIKRLDDALPLIYLLMEDGSVEWILIDLKNAEDTNYRFITQIIPLAKNIESIFIEKETEGMGVEKVYGKNKDMTLDLNMAISWMHLWDGTWIMETQKPEIFIALTFYKEGAFLFEKGNIWGSHYQSFAGTYHLNLDPSVDEKLGILSLDVKPDYHGQYFTEVNHAIHFQAWVIEDNIFNEENIAFTLGQNPIKEVVDAPVEYLMHRSDTVKNLVEKHHMKFLIEEETTDINSETCYQVWLGTDHQEKFTKEILYAISQTGNIYEFDVLENKWLTVYKTGA